MPSDPIHPPARGRAWKFLRRTVAGWILLVVLYLALLASGVFDCAPPDLSRFQRAPVPANAFDVLELPKDPRYQQAIARTKDKSFDVFRDDKASNAPPSLQEAWNNHIQETKDFLAEICACPGPWTIGPAKDAPGYAGFEDYRNLHTMAADLQCQANLRSRDPGQIEVVRMLVSIQLALGLRMLEASESSLLATAAILTTPKSRLGLSWCLHHNPDREYLEKLAEQLRQLEKSTMETVSRSIRGEVVHASYMINNFPVAPHQIELPGVSRSERVVRYFGYLFYQRNRTLKDFSGQVDVLAENCTREPDQRMPVPFSRDLPVWFPHPNLIGNRLLMDNVEGVERWLIGCDQQRASSALMRTAVAVERFRLDHQGKWPENLAALVPDYLDTIASSPSGVTMTLDPRSHVLSFGPVTLKATDPHSGYAPGAGQLRDIDAPAIDLGTLLAE